MKDSYGLFSREEKKKFEFIDPELRELQIKSIYIYMDLSFMCRSEGALKEFEEKLDNEIKEMNREEDIRIHKRAINKSFIRLEKYINNGLTCEALEERGYLEFLVNELIELMR
jgi:hypothetical protein